MASTTRMPRGSLLDADVTIGLALLKFSRFGHVPILPQNRGIQKIELDGNFEKASIFMKAEPREQSDCNLLRRT